MKINLYESELYFLPFVMVAPIVTSVLFFYGGYWKIGLVIIIGHVFPLIMTIKKMFEHINDEIKKDN